MDILEEAAHIQVTRPEADELSSPEICEGDIVEMVFAATRDYCRRKYTGHYSAPRYIPAVLSAPGRKEGQRSQQLETPHLFVEPVRRNALRYLLKRFLEN